MDLGRKPYLERVKDTQDPNSRKVWVREAPEQQRNPLQREGGDGDRFEVITNHQMPHSGGMGHELCCNGRTMTIPDHLGHRRPDLGGTSIPSLPRPQTQHDHSHYPLFRRGTDMSQATRALTPQIERGKLALETTTSNRNTPSKRKIIENEDLEEGARPKEKTRRQHMERGSLI